jgi:hypothetical protein
MSAANRNTFISPVLTYRVKQKEDRRQQTEDMQHKKWGGEGLRFEGIEIEGDEITEKMSRNQT